MLKCPTFSTLIVHIQNWKSILNMWTKKTYYALACINGMIKVSVLCTLNLNLDNHSFCKQSLFSLFTHLTKWFEHVWKAQETRCLGKREDAHEGGGRNTMQKTWKELIL